MYYDSFLWSSSHSFTKILIFFFRSINFGGALGDLRIKFQLRHGQLEQMQEQKTRRDGETTRSIATPWPTSVKSLKMYGNPMVKSKKNNKESDSIKQKLPCGPFPREVMGLKWDGIEYGWLHRHMSDHTPPPLMRSLSHSHLKVPIISRVEASWRILTCA